VSAARPLLVVALGGNAVSPPRGGLTLAVERDLIRRAAGELAALAADARLLIVHGNGPQVGRLLIAESAGDPADLDILVAQTQGELGYLLAEALETRLGTRCCAALITRAVVAADDPGFAHPTKPVGPVLARPPAAVPAMRLADGSGWRRVVASPRPTGVLELDIIRRLLADTHVVAGGGGGVALMQAGGRREPRPAVIDKDWTAALLATRLHADRLLYVTDVAYAYDDFGGAGQRPIATMTAAAARSRLAAGVFPPGCMGPKVASAIDFVVASGRPAVIAALGEVEAALRGRAGTTITAA
jgi:carbamate kinase